MITISVQNAYYIFSVIAVLCGASYKLGYEIGKNKRKSVCKLSIFIFAIKQRINLLLVI